MARHAALKAIAVGVGVALWVSALAWVGANRAQTAVKQEVTTRAQGSCKSSTALRALETKGAGLFARLDELLIDPTTKDPAVQEAHRAILAYVGDVRAFVATNPNCAGVTLPAASP